MKGIQGVINSDLILMLLQEGIIVSIGGKEKYMIKLQIFKKVNGKWKKVEPKKEEAICGYEGGKFAIISPTWLFKYVIKSEEE